VTEIRKLATILAADVVGYSRLGGTNEDRTLARLRALRSDLIDPTVAAHNGRVVKRTGDGSKSSSSPDVRSRMYGLPLDIPSVSPGLSQDFFACSRLT
jgi:class 3 adenylate cyclase